jgi:hypothetical protein
MKIRVLQVMHGHAWRSLLTASPESGEGIDCFVISPKDGMMFETNEILLEIPYHQVVCRMLESRQYDSPMT